MSGFKVGKFARHQVSAPLRHVCPSEAKLSLADIDLADLARQGKRLILIDVDNTLLPWRSEELPKETLDWFKKGRQLGLEFCMISNTRNVARLKRLSKVLGSHHVVGKFKPSRRMFLQALKDFNVQPHEAVMIGDQLLTDILGANRSGIEAIWVKQADSREFIGTKVNRLFEWLIRSRLYRVMEQEDDDLPIVSHEGIFKHKVVRQFVKFCIVGGTSFVVDTGTTNFLMFKLHIGGEVAGELVGRMMLTYASSLFWFASKPTEASIVPAAIIGAALGILNSFLFNRSWTFNIRGDQERTKQLRRFLVVSIIGLALNATFTTGFNKMFGVVFLHEPDRSMLLAKVVSAGIVAFWNFSGQRFWAFKREQ